MTEERIRALSDIGFDWRATKTDLASIWSVRFQQLCEFKAQFGHCLVTQRYSTNPKLGWWVTIQCSEYRKNTKGKPTTMAEERIRELESLGFDWGTSKTNLASIWSVRFQQLCEFGHCLVPQQYAASPKLGQWLSKQRSTYRKHQERRRTSMPEERIRELESIGFVWETTSD